MEGLREGKVRTCPRAVQRIKSVYPDVSHTQAHNDLQRKSHILGLRHEAINVCQTHHKELPQVITWPGCPSICRDACITSGWKLWSVLPFQFAVRVHHEGRHSRSCCLLPGLCLFGSFTAGNDLSTPHIQQISLDLS
jgi:hypothetical protein